MKASGSKEEILKHIRKALEHKVQQPFSNIDTQSNVFYSQHQGLEVLFAQSFTELGGIFIYCDNPLEFVDNLQQLINERGWSNISCNDEKLLNLFAKKDITSVAHHQTLHEIEPCDAGITTCEFLVARTGSIALSSKLQSGRGLSIYPPIHIVVAFNTQIVFDLKDALYQFKEKYPKQLPSLINFATGPSRTADIEKTLVVGVHGPKEVIVFFIDENVDD